MGGKRFAVDAVLGAAAGLAGVQAMTPVTTRLYERESDEDKQRESAVSYGVAYEVAAKRTAELLGTKLDDDAAGKVGSVLHYGLGVAWAPVYIWLRRVRGMGPLAAGLTTGLSLELLVDQGANTLLGFTPPPSAYPLATQVRGVAAHLAFGLALAAAMEVGWTLLRERP